MRVQYVDLIASQESSELDQPDWILDAASRIATVAGDALRLHVLAQPRRDWIERRKVHLEPRAVVPPGKLRKKPAGVAVLSEVKDAFHCQ